MEYITAQKGAEDLGEVTFSSDVFADIAKTALEKTKDVVSAKKDNAVTCKIKDNGMTIVASVRMKFGSNVVRIGEELQKRIHDDIAEMTGVSDVKVQLDVVGFLPESDA